MKIIYILFCISLTIYCPAQQKIKTKKIKGVGIAQKTSNPNTPYIYKNGYLNYEIIKVPVAQEKDTIYLHELKFNAVFSAMYTKKMMYENFGKWTKEVRPNNDKHPILIWEKIKLFENNDKLYTVYTNGDENWNEIYASVCVFDEKDTDCLSDIYPDKIKITEYFANGIKNLKNKEQFYKVYWDSVNSYDRKKN